MTSLWYQRNCLRIVLQVGGLAATSTPARMTMDSTRHSSFRLSNTSHTATAVSLDGWQAKPIGQSRRSQLVAQAESSSAALAEAAVKQQHAELAAAAWVYEMQWQAAALASTASPEQQRLSHGACSLQWQLQRTADVGGKVGSTASGCIGTGSSLGICLGLLRVLQLPAARQGFQLTLSMPCSRGGSLCSSAAESADGRTAAAVAASALLRTAALEQPQLRRELVLFDHASWLRQRADRVSDEAELWQSASATHVPR